MATVILNLAYLSMFSSTMVRGMIWLRSLLITGAIGLATFGAINGVKSVVMWNIIIGTFHTRQLIIYIRSRRAVKLTPEQRTFHQQFFPELDEFDFFSLWSMGVDHRSEANEYLAHQGQAQDAIYLLHEGAAEVRHPNGATHHLGPGALVGEISFISGETANADVVSIGDVHAHKWDQNQLAALDQLNPAANRAMEGFIGRDLAAKLA